MSLETTIRPVKIAEEMRDSYLDYAMSVIVSRALPDVRDGLKPVHRRILYALHEMGVRANSSYRKSARIVGEVLGKYHPHGDSAVYDAMARMTQDFSMRYQLIDGQGNFGSIDGDPPAAMRYTEARMARIAEELLADINADTIDFSPNFDGSLEEPIVLPARIPNLLLNGSSGIAVGMATNIPPHNLRELAAAIDYLLELMIGFEGPDENLDDAVIDVTVDNLMQFVRGPDFPTGAIFGGDELTEVYATGKGRIICRARMHVEEMPGDRFRLVVTEIPYQLNKTSILEKIAQLANEGRLEGIATLRDESDRDGMRVVIELRRGAQPLTVMNRLYKYTQLQSTFGVQMLALVNQEPRLLSLKKMLMHWIYHRYEVIQRRTEYELRNAKARAHILEGLLKALADIDEIISTIRFADSADDARTALMENFDLSQEQAQAILDLQLRRLAALEQQKIQKEYDGLVELIGELETLLADPRKILTLIRDDLREMADKYGDDRKSEYDPSISVNFDESQLVRDEEVLISLTKRGYIKRTPSNIYRQQRRGGRGALGMSTRDEDVVEHLFRAGTLDHLLFFTNYGRVYSLRTYELPEYDKAGRGLLIEGTLPVDLGEKVTAAIAVPSFEDMAGSFTMCTTYGRIKRVEVKAFSNVRSTGIIAMNLDRDDTLSWVRHTSGTDHVMIVTEMGQSIRFKETDVRVMGRTAGGVNAIRLSEGDKIAAMDIIREEDVNSELLIVTERGYGKRTPVEEFRVQGRYGSGIRAISRDLTKTGPILGSRVINPEEDPDLTVITRHGVALRTPVDSINTYSRQARGVKIINLDKGDTVVSIALVMGKTETSDERDDVEDFSPNNGAELSYAEDEMLDEPGVDEAV
jgi:DNA gyrase subunit A